MFVEYLEAIEKDKKSTLGMKISDIARLLNSASYLQGQCACPTCMRDITIDISKEIPILKEKLEYYKKLEREEQIKNAPRLEAERKKREQDRFAWYDKVNKYIEDNKKIFRKVIRSWIETGDIKLPIIPEEDKKLWNKSIELFIENSKAYQDIDYSDFQFEE